MRQKLNTDRGETLVEVLASILIASLSVALLFGCVMASFNMDRDAKELDKKHYEALTAAETYTESVEYPAQADKVTVINEALSAPLDPTKKASKEVLVNIYGGAGMYSYKRAGT